MGTILLLLLRWIKRVAGLTAVVYVAVYPHTIGWILAGVGWTLDTSFYHAAIYFWTHFDLPEHNLEDALRGRALVHSYLGECEQAIHLYEHVLGPWREEHCPKLPSGLVRYRRRQVFDIVRIYDACAGQTERALALANDAQQRLTDTAVADGAKFEAQNSQQATVSLSEALYALYYAVEVVYREMVSGAILQAMSPIAVTQSMLVPAHQEYLALVQQHLTNLTLTKQQQSVSLPLLLQHGFQTEPFNSVWIGWHMAELFHYCFPYRNRLRWILTVTGGLWRFNQVWKQRLVQDNGLAKVLMAAEQCPPQKAWKKLRLLEIARQQIVQAPTRPVVLLHGLAVALVAEAVDASVHMGYVDQVDQLVNIYVDLWKAKRHAVMTDLSEVPIFNETHPITKALTPHHATHVYIMAPVRVRWAAGNITEMREYDNFMLQRAADWKRMNLTNLDFHIKTLLPRPDEQEKF